jgi:AcrR family transcriptional regulator
VDVLAKKLGVTRGSFYWHFKDREDLLRAVLQAWQELATENLTRRLESASTDPQEQLRDVLSLPFRGDSALRASRIELAIRAWARRDAMARQAVDQADAARISYIAQIFSGLGYGLAEARNRALLTYSVNVACSLLTPASGVSRPEELLAYAARLMQAEPLKA